MELKAVNEVHITDYHYQADSTYFTIRFVNGTFDSVRDDNGEPMRPPTKPARDTWKLMELISQEITRLEMKLAEKKTLTPEEASKRVIAECKAKSKGA